MELIFKKILSPMKLGFKAFSKQEEDFFLMKTVCRLSFYDVRFEASRKETLTGGH
jgi:hypothetical protein